MVMGFVAGMAGINVLGRLAGARVVVADSEDRLAAAMRLPRGAARQVSKSAAPVTGITG